MSHIFISYSRRDLDFAQKIVDALAATKLDARIGWKRIPKGGKTGSRKTIVTVKMRIRSVQNAITLSTYIDQDASKANK